MSLEAETIAEVAENGGGDKRSARSERRGKDRRQAGTRVNMQAPRRSTMKALGALATGISVALLAIVLLASGMVLDETPWPALMVTALAVVVSSFALMIGSLEQRLIEIRLELMMTNGGMRQVDRRSGRDRRDRDDFRGPIDPPAKLDVTARTPVG